MARYGIDRALLAEEQPGTDHPVDRIIEIANPWARVQAHLLCRLAEAMRCQSIILPRRGAGSRIHLFGFASDIERVEVLYTSLLVQMWQGLAAMTVPAEIQSPRAWRRSWLLGFVAAVVARVRAAEQQAVSQASGGEPAGGGSRAELVLADRQQIIRRNLERAYPVTRKVRMTYTGSGYRDGYAKGTQADLGGPHGCTAALLPAHWARAAGTESSHSPRRGSRVGVALALGLIVRHAAMQRRRCRAVLVIPANGNP
jgi:hypothetical protein